MAGNTNWNILHISGIFQKVLTLFFSVLKIRFKKLDLSGWNTSFKFFHMKNHRIVEWLTSICLQINVVLHAVSQIPWLLHFT